MLQDLINGYCLKKILPPGGSFYSFSILSPTYPMFYFFIHHQTHLLQGASLTTIYKAGHIDDLMVLIESSLMFYIEEYFFHY